ncbi:unnamed protein product [Calypogeia fissa]
MSDAIVNGLAGAGGGIVAQLLTYPLQAVNTRQQIERISKKGNAVPNAAQPGFGIPCLEESLGKNQPQSKILKVIKQEGWGGLYRGLGPSLVGTICSQGVYYYFYQLFKDKAESRYRKKKKHGSGDGTVGMFGSLLVAALAGCVNVLLTNPIWVIVTRMQTQAKAQIKPCPSLRSTPGRDASSVIDPSRRRSVVRADGALATVRELYDEAGLVGFWKGVLPTLIMVSNPAIQFMLYESLVKWLTKKRPVRKYGLKYMTATEVFTLGAIAKLGATVVTYPLLVVKSRLQAKQSRVGDTSQQYAGTLDVIVKMVRYEGLLGFYKGMSTKIVQSVVAAAVLFMIKEELVKGARALVSKTKSSH